MIFLNLQLLTLVSFHVTFIKNVKFNLVYTINLVFMKISFMLLLQFFILNMDLNIVHCFQYIIFCIHHCHHLQKHIIICINDLYLIHFFILNELLIFMLISFILISTCIPILHQMLFNYLYYFIFLILIIGGKFFL